jgi:predicted RNA binding protein YcfA (HicA-like mRNA interferase family)
MFIIKPAATCKMHHPTKAGMVTVAGKPMDDLNPKTLKSILKQAGLQPREK